MKPTGTTTTYTIEVKEFSPRLKGTEFEAFGRPAMFDIEQNLEEAIRVETLAREAYGNTPGVYIERKLVWIH